MDAADIVELVTDDEIAQYKLNNDCSRICDLCIRAIIRNEKIITCHTDDRLIRSVIIFNGDFIIIPVIYASFCSSHKCWYSSGKSKLKYYKETYYIISGSLITKLKHYH